MYRERIADAELAQRLESAGAVLVEGCRACGKTSLARQAAGSEVLLDVDESARQAAAIEPALVLEGDAPRLIDEWQVEPAIWNHVRRAVDRSDAPGRFLLTGSAVPADDITRHTGAGRISRLHLRTMSLYETGFSTGEASLGDLLGGRFRGCADSGTRLEEVVVQLCRGGWPGDLERSDRACMTARADYLKEVCRVDVTRVDGVRRDPDAVGRTLRSLARNIATPVSMGTIAADAGGDRPLGYDTVRAYLRALERLMVIEEQPAWSTHLRSRSRLRASPKRHFVDPSLAAAALGATPKRLRDDIRFLGLLFESMVWRDLSIHARPNDAAVHYYRDNTKLEVDMVVETRGGEWCAFEVKLGAGQIEDAAATLHKFRDRVSTEKRGEPSVLGVIVPSGYGFVRPDGIAVIPVGALGP